MKSARIPLAAAAALAATSAHAYEVRARWVERIGTINVVVPFVNGLQTAVILPGSTHTFRLQFGVFDTPGSAAPAGGFVGWNVGMLDFTGGITTNNSRIAPFNFAPGGAGTIVDGQDVVGIDATQGLQSAVWTWNPDTHMPNPPPEARIFGLNTFVDVFSIRTLSGSFDYTVTATGNEVIATGWNIIGGPPDENNPSVDVTLVPVTLAPVSFSWPMLIGGCPAPGALPLLGLAGFVALGRHRRRDTLAPARPHAPAPAPAPPSARRRKR